MNRWSLPIIGLLLICAPATALAATTTWSFVDQAKVEGWNHGNLTTMQLLPQGLQVRTDTEGELVKVADIKQSVDTVTISYTALNDSKGGFLWRPKGKSIQEVYHIAIDFRAGGHQKMILDVSKIPQWNPTSDRIGLIFGAGTDLILEKMEFSNADLRSQMFYGWKTFWTFDTFRPYSVNFVWGPMLTSSQEQLTHMFDQNPPAARTANTVFYYAIFALAVLYFVVRRLRGKFAPWTQKLVTALVVVTAGSWIVYDIRMGAEFISYARQDIASWWSQPMDLKDFRDRGTYNAYLKAVTPFLKDEKVFVFSSSGWPYSGSMRYAAYPARPIEVMNDPDIAKAKYWLVYGTRKVQFDERTKMLVTQDGPLAGPGKVVLNFEPGAFVFEISPSPPSE